MRSLKPILAAILMLLTLAAHSRAGELWVDGRADANALGPAAASGPADGSPQRPFVTIAAALKAAAPGDTVTVKAGVYHEMLRMPSGAADKPITLRSAPGEWAVISGGKRVEGSKKFNDHVWVASVPARPAKFFTNLQARTLSRMPEEGWWVAESATARSLTDSKNLPAMTASPLQAEARVWTQVSYGTYLAAVTAFDREGGTISIAPSDDKMKLYAGDRYYLRGSPEFLRRSGEWGVREANGACELYYWPADVKELDTAEVPFAKECPVTILGAHDVAVEGLRVSVCDGGAINIQNSRSVTVSGCILSDLRAQGLAVRDSNHVTVRRNLVYGASGLAWIGGGCDVTVEENEVHNDAAGIEILYTSRDVLVRRNLLFGSPDEFRERYGIHVSCEGDGIRLIDNLCLRQRTGIYVRSGPGGELRGNMVAGATTSLLTVAEGAANFRIVGNTFAFASYDGVVVEGNSQTFRQNVCGPCDDHVVYTAAVTTSFASDRNLFWDASGAKNPFALGKKGYPNLGLFQAATGQDGASLYEDPAFRGAPAFVRSLDGQRIQECTRQKLVLHEKSAGFAVGDLVETAFDGRLRKVTAVEGRSITVDPPLDLAPETPVVVANWRDRPDARLDLRLGAKSPGLTMGDGGSTSPATSGSTSQPASGPTIPTTIGSTTGGAGTPIGSQVDIQAYLRGDFDGSGKRVVPEMPNVPGSLK